MWWAQRLAWSAWAQGVKRCHLDLVGLTGHWLPWRKFTSLVKILGYDA